MKKPASPVKTEKRAKSTPEEKSARKSAKSAGRASADLNEDRASKKASQKKSLKSAAKQLQKELNARMNEVVTRIRKETKAKLKEVVKEATRRLDGDTERMFEQALHTIVRHYDSVSGPTAADNGQAATSTATGKAARGSKKGPTLNKDGTPRKPRAPRDGDEAATEITAAAPAASGRSRKPAAAKAKTTGAKRGPKPAAATAAASTGAKRGPKPRAQAAPAPEPEATGVINSADSPGTGEVSA
ncbi:hypothetical protein ACVWYF_002812 [Hymenobacter sp. UYAg731]